MYEFAVDFIEPYNIRFSEKFECRTTKKRRKTDDNVIHVTDKPPRGGTPHMKVVGMLVVSLRGVNLGFWSHLGCSGQNAIILSREGLL